MMKKYGPALHTDNGPARRGKKYLLDVHAIGCPRPVAGEEPELLYRPAGLRLNRGGAKGNGEWNEERGPACERGYCRSDH
jgi:hypothetical protein